MRVQSSSRCQVSSTRVIGRFGVPVTWCAVVNMVIIPCAYSRTRDEILWRHAAMVEAGLSETGGITGALGKAASRVVPDPMLGFITSRLCIGWPRGDARGSFYSYSPRAAMRYQHQAQGRDQVIAAALSAMATAKPVVAVDISTTD